MEMDKNNKTMIDTHEFYNDFIKKLNILREQKYKLFYLFNKKLEEEKIKEIKKELSS